MTLSSNVDPGAMPTAVFRAIRFESGPAGGPPVDAERQTMPVVCYKVAETGADGRQSKCDRQCRR